MNLTPVINVIYIIFGQSNLQKSLMNLQECISTVGIPQGSNLASVLFLVNVLPIKVINIFHT
jgi:hypothetical protein